MSAELIAILAVGAALCGLFQWEHHRLGLHKHLRDARNERRGARTDRARIASTGAWTGGKRR